MQKKGKFIVIDGSSGSGKYTQSTLLQKYLKKRKIKFRYYDFPDYTSFWGKLVRRFLQGEFGKLEDVSPYLASIPFAQDRATHNEEMNKWLDNGGFILSNRYVTSSIVHQGVKFKKNEEKKKFIKWISHLEYDINKMPKETAVIYLKVDIPVILELLKRRNSNKNIKDIEEENIPYLKSVEKMYKLLQKENDNWHLIDCTPKGKLLSIDKISEEVIRITNSILF